MRPEKMSAEVLTRMCTKYAGATTPDAHDVRQCLRHIAAVEAERDGLKDDLRLANEVADGYEAERDALRGRVEEERKLAEVLPPREMERLHRALDRIAKTAETHARALSSVEPSTAEAFAFCRVVLAKEQGSSTPNPRALEHLSLLERRMGAMGRAIESVRRDMRDPDEPTRVSIATCDAIEAALTDAPPVFTLEEVEKAMRSRSPGRVAMSDELIAEVRFRLSAPRR